MDPARGLTRALGRGAGRTGLERFFLRSVAEEVVRRAPQPALTVGRGAVPPDEVDDKAVLSAIATHGRSGLERVLTGSVAETVLRRAPCPVFTVTSFGYSLVQD